MRLPEYGYEITAFGAEGSVDFVRFGTQIELGIENFRIGVSRITLRNLTTLEESKTFDRIRIFGFSDVVVGTLVEPLPPENIGGPGAPGPDGWAIPVPDECVRRLFRRV